MQKLNGSFGIDSNAVSIDALKSADVGDMVLFLDEVGTLTLFTVTSKATQRGRKGGTSLALQDVVNDTMMALQNTNTLPEGVLMVRKVLKGVNIRTMRKVVPEAAPIVSLDALNAPTESVSEPVVDFAQGSEPEDIGALISEVIAMQGEVIAVGE